MGCDCINSWSLPFYKLTDVANVVSKPRFRHYPFTLEVGFLCLHHRPMLDPILLTKVSSSD